jgi:hypothetical protein
MGNLGSWKNPRKESSLQILNQFLINPGKIFGPKRESIYKGIETEVFLEIQAHPCPQGITRNEPGLAFPHEENQCRLVFHMKTGGPHTGFIKPKSRIKTRPHPLNLNPKAPAHAEVGCPKGGSLAV